MLVVVQFLFTFSFFTAEIGKIDFRLGHDNPIPA